MLNRNTSQYDSELLAKTQRSALRIVTENNTNKAIHYYMRQRFSTVLAKWLLQNGLVIYGLSGNRIIVDLYARQQAAKAARTLTLMCTRSSHKGQQAAEIAEMSLARVSSGNCTFEEFEKNATNFRSMRVMHIRRSAEKTAHTEKFLIPLPGGWSARQLRSYADIDHTGAIMRNCLANKRYSKNFKRRLRKGEEKLIVLETMSDNPQVLIRIDTDTNEVLEVKGARNQIPKSQRETIIQALVKLKVDVSCDDAVELCVTETIIHSRVDERSWFRSAAGRKCEFGPNFLSLECEGNFLLLESRQCDQDGRPLVLTEQNHNAFIAESRDWLRNLCGTDPDFRQDCLRAWDCRSFCV